MWVTSRAEATIFTHSGHSHPLDVTPASEAGPSKAPTALPLSGPVLPSRHSARPKGFEPLTF
jgi:hypothetical protein